jgi:hypothetical protein
LAANRFHHIASRGRRWLIAVIPLAVALLGFALPETVHGASRASVAVVAGKPIERQVLNHWLFVFANAANGPDSPVIVPSDPPRFNHCVARVRAVIPGLRDTSAETIRADCATLFTNLSRPVLDLLITADWQEDEAATDGVVVSAAQVEHAYRLDRRRLYPTRRQFRRYLHRTGETIADVMFRVRSQVIRGALLKAEHLTAGALDAELRSRFKPETECARFYITSDCAGG